jgi:S1-C subfamily serine protease
MTIARQIETELTAITQHLSSITVEIGDRRGGGSGVIWWSNGLIVTNSHVARSSIVNVKLEDDRTFKGTVIARDNQQDLALIQIEAKQLLTPTIGNTRLLRPGEIVLAVGSPWGFTGALTIGVIHATGCNEIGQSPIPTAIAADIRLAPGNSGGVLANVRGEAIGINTAIYLGLALAIPIETVTAFIGEVIGKK